MADFTWLFSDKKSYELEKVFYSRKEDPIMQEENLKVLVEDSIAFETMNQEALTVRYTRHVYFKPEGSFELTVTCLVKHYFEKEESTQTAVKAFDVIQQINLNRDYFVADAPANVSLLIAQMTGLYHSSCFIFPPIYMSNDK